MKSTIPGFFDFKKDKISKNCVIENQVIETIINELYYPESPMNSLYFSVEILGSAYGIPGKVFRFIPLTMQRLKKTLKSEKWWGILYTQSHC
jgi:hypothetical protein